VVDGISQKFFVQRRKYRSRQLRLNYVVIFIDSRDICAQTRKLSQIAPIFERFMLSQILGGAVPLKVVLALNPNLEPRQVPKFRWAKPLTPKL